jgi:hypothetical protein
MRIKIGVENNYEGRSLAWVLDYPGCFAYGADGSEAILRVPEALLRYKEWIDSHLPDSWMKDLADFDIHLEESYEVFTINERYELVTDGYEVNAWFRHDWNPLSAEDIRRGRLILEWSRADLLDLVASLSPAQLECMFEGERWSIAGVLGHIANAEHWYLDRLDLAQGARRDLPRDVFERLHIVRQRMNAVLPELEGMQKVLGIDGEFWSPRKVIRRSTEHEIDHIDHIFKLIARLG